MYRLGTEVNTMRQYRIGLLIGLMCFWDIALSEGAESELNRQVLPQNNVSSSNPPAPVPTTLDCLIEPHTAVDVATAISGIVKDVLVDRGDLVKNEQVLAYLNDEVEKANLAQASARMAFSARKLKRMQTLSKKRMVSSEMLDEAKSENDLAKAELQKADALLKQRTILSPIQGVIVEKYVAKGELVENNKIVRIAQLDPLNVEIVAPVSMLGNFIKGATVQVYPEGPHKGPFDAHVARVDRVVDAASGMFRVRLNLPNPDYTISAGVRCKAVHQTNEHHE